MGNHLLFELGTEELPSLSVLPLAEIAKKWIRRRISGSQTILEKIDYYATPRRIAVIVHNLAEESESETIIKRGPSLDQGYDAAGNPTKALLGFARSIGVDVQALSTKKRR